MINKKRNNGNMPAKKRLKLILARVILWFLGRGIEAAAALDHKIREEIAGWPESMTMLMTVRPRGPSLTMGVRNGKLVCLGPKETDADFAVYFKNIDSALLVLTGQVGIDRAYAEHRFAMKGDIITYGMPLVRSLYRVEAYLFPSFITRKILKKIPGKQTSSLRVYLKALSGI